MPFFKSLSQEATAFDVFSLFPELYESMAVLSDKLFCGPSPIEMRDRQLLFTYVSHLNACQYCFGGHAAVAEALGVERKVIDDLTQDIEGATVDEKLKTLVRYVKKLNETPTRMIQADADAVFAVGWDEEALEHAIALCCLANFMNRLVEGHGVEARPEDFARRATLAVEHGYLKPFQLRTRTAAASS